MSKVLIIAEHLDGQLNPSTAKCVSAAAKLSPQAIDILVLAEQADAIAADAAKIDGVGTVLTVSRAENAQPLAAILAPQVAKAADGYSHVFGPSTTFGKDLMPRVAALLGVGQVSDLMEVIDAHSFKRPIYAGNAIVTVTAPADAPVIATVRTASFPAAGSNGSAAVQALDLDVELPGHTRFVELKAGKSDRPDLQTASRVISGGRALGSGEAFKVIYSLADKLGAGVGA
ncbi:MAG: electron transfer flavoprotein subunit alpha/FixB family protein, partial [Lysobacterales bacterium]